MTFYYFKEVSVPKCFINLQIYTVEKNYGSSLDAYIFVNLWIKFIENTIKELIYMGELAGL